MKYEIKWLQEAGWAAAVAVGAYVAQVASQAQDVDDWRAFAVAAALGCVRVALAAAGNALAGKGAS